VDELDGDRSLSYGGRNAFHAFRADIANGEDTRHTRFEEIWLAAVKANVSLPIGRQFESALSEQEEAARKRCLPSTALMSNP
jgi:hypothetical protein